MATASVTNTFTNGTTADADDVNANFTDLVNFLNASTVHADGAVPMTGTLDLGGFGVKNLGSFLTAGSGVDPGPKSVGSAAWTQWVGPGVTITDPGVPVRVFAFAHASAKRASGTGTVYGRMRTTIDGTAATASGRVAVEANPDFIACNQVRAFDPTGNFNVQIEVYSDSGSLDFENASLTVLVIPQ